MYFVASGHTETIRSLDLAVPAALLLVTFLLKLFIDRRVEFPMFIAALCELPVEMGFLATSFIAAFTMASTEQTGIGFFLFVVYTLAVIVTVVLWRRSQHMFDVQRNVATLLFFVPNFALALLLLWGAIQFVVTPIT